MTDVEETLRPLDLLTYTGPLYVKNLSRTKLVHDADGQLLTLGPNGTESDLALLPLTVAQNPGFQKAWRTGQVLVSKDPEMEEALRLVELSSQKQSALRSQELQGKIEASSSDKAVRGTSCLACNNQVFQNAQQAKSQPPLCPVHEQRASEYVATQSQDEEGNAVTTWSSIA